MRKVSIIGAGRLGGALAIALARSGFSVESIVSRDGTVGKAVSDALPSDVALRAFPSIDVIDSDVVVIAVQDGQVPAVAEGLRGKLRQGTVVLHTSGSLSSEALDGLADSGISTGSMHPLVSLSDPVLGAERFKDGFFCIEGDEAAAAVADEMVGALGGTAFSIDRGKKSLYHAAAVTACGHVVALLDIAFELLAECGLSKDEAKKALLPLVESTVRNLETQLPEDALTGPFARADVSTVERNIEAVAGTGKEEALEAFMLLGERSVELARRKGAKPDDLGRILGAINLVKERPR